MAESYSLALGGLHVQWQKPPAAGQARVHLDGDLDNLSLPVLRQALDSVYAAGCFTISLDVSGLEFIDSSGSGPWSAPGAAARRQAGNLAVVNPSIAVRRLMDMTGIGKILGPTQ